MFESMIFRTSLSVGYVSIPWVRVVFFFRSMDPRKPHHWGPNLGPSNLLRFALALQGEATEVFSIDADEGSGSSDPPELQVPRLV